MKGVVPPMLTPFKENGDLDEVGLGILVEFLSDEVDGLFVTGSYGSGPMMNQEERKRVVELSVKHAAGKVPVIPMVGTTNNRDSVDLAVHAQANGAAAVAAVGPYYFNHNEDDLIDFYGALIDAVSIPVYL
jgi:dihydrodipicolinate synthase/N-acetylneuraminate lyase